MRETLGSQGVQILLGKLRDQQKKTDEAEKKVSRQRTADH